MHWLMTLTLAALEPSGVALLDDGLTASELEGARAGVRAAGFTVLTDDEVRAAVAALAAQGIVCDSQDTACLAKVALLAEAEAVVAFTPAGSGLSVRAVDASPRVGTALALSRTPAELAQATEGALRARTSSASAAPTASEPQGAAQGASTAHETARTASAAPSASSSAPTGAPSSASSSAPPSAPTSGWSLAGAGLAGAGLVALAAGGYAAVLAGESMQSAEGARFQDDTARFGDEANARMWLGGGAIALGLSAVAGGAVLVFGGGP